MYWDCVYVLSDKMNVELIKGGLITTMNITRRTILTAHVVGRTRAPKGHSSSNDDDVTPHTGASFQDLKAGTLQH